MELRRLLILSTIKQLGFTMALLPFLGTMSVARGGGSAANPHACYQVSLLAISPLRLSVRATLPIDGDTLQMDNSSYPAELDELAQKGWPALVAGLEVEDSSGQKVDVTPVYPNRWVLSRKVSGLLQCQYQVDYSLFASHNWSSPLESAFADSSMACIAGRSVFITTPQVGIATVEFTVPAGFNPVVPWVQESPTSHRYAVVSQASLIDNMLVFAPTPPDTFTVSGFRFQLVVTGHWKPLRSLVLNSLMKIVKREVDMMLCTDSDIYTVILQPLSDEGGNAFQQSFAYVYTNPDSANRSQWCNKLAHEIFHYWNYGKLRGASYASSQWFQEGFTEYTANLVLANTGISDSGTFLRKLSEHVANYRKLTTTLENPGTHKGPPLYSAGALVAFMWDIMIREGSGGRSDIGSLFRNLMTQTDSGKNRYSWTDIEAALQATCKGNWQAFFLSHVRGSEALPFDQILPLAGLKLIKSPEGIESVVIDPAASAKGKSLLRSMLGS
jgi:predicted metalloprotease with PDZ domain